MSKRHVGHWRYLLPGDKNSNLHVCCRKNSLQCAARTATVAWYLQHVCGGSSTFHSMIIIMMHNSRVFFSVVRKSLSAPGEGGGGATKSSFFSSPSVTASKALPLPPLGGLLFRPTAGCGVGALPPRWLNNFARFQRFPCCLSKAVAVVTAKWNSIVSSVQISPSFSRKFSLLNVSRPESTSKAFGRAPASTDTQLSTMGLQCAMRGLSSPSAHGVAGTAPHLTIEVIWSRVNP
mmetsp:Transcript_72459/g.207870  ORF Transcript_72459/g.207870 Transcript_72459/m.207870 type:complete len:234 (+) Transcript_72459:173-874(+)|eukprot:CAMPEP_0177160278 /NCGR_PEP_ID=MMETSP0367-20130122/4743_1 /TAXON_ID=447022 ORGANISM="Scrippsiella hangoei-like, Strain SHHI-4" /NCGR_SAMPLE_ID=MMETSP0367 /ASSEMBLY_ACC=CAM_ASM_000362 /LENGTH=233 /DNA_ID=CAMNT_0018605925 /DNA_START=98 /DNA_END=799 /DNA_ORIENTATION=+